MTVEETYKILKDLKMSTKECNFKVKNNKPGGDRTPKWFNKFYDEEFKPLQQAVVNMQTQPPKYFLDFQKQMLDFVKEQRQFNKSIMSRIDNLVSKNNLKE